MSGGRCAVPGGITIASGGVCDVTLDPLTLPQNAQVLRQEVCCLLEKGAVERVPPSELESGFDSTISWYPKRRGTPPDSCSQAHQQSALKMSVQDDNAETDPGAISPRGLVASVDLKDTYFHIQIALHHICFLRFAFEGIAYQYSALPFRLALAPCTFSKFSDPQ